MHWVYDTFALANGTGSAVVKAGGKSWFFLTADYAFGYALQRDVADVVTKAGGKVLGEVRHPINTNDFSSFLLQAQASKAQIIGLANAGGDTINSIKQASEFGIVKGGQKLAGLLVFVTDVHSLGLERAQGLNLTEAFYWDLNDKTRAFSKRFAAKHNGKMPTSIQAGFYSAALQLPQRGQGGRHRRQRQGDGQAQGRSSGTTRCSARATSAPTAARCTTCTCSRSRSRRSPRGPGTTTSSSRRFRPRRPSGRWTRANARWSKKN